MAYKDRREWGIDRLIMIHDIYDDLPWSFDGSNVGSRHVGFMQICAKSLSGCCDECYAL